MVIGISGKIGSGKDTIGSIIQYLTCKSNQIGDDNGSLYALQKKNPILYGNYNSYLKELYPKSIYKSNWEVKKFAYKLKQVCSLLTGISVEDFEKQEVKDRLLGEEWDTVNSSFSNLSNVKTSYNLILRYGFKGSGKYSSSQEEYKEEDLCYEKAKKDGWVPYGINSWGIPVITRTKNTIRWLLQTVGTEAMRNNIHENVWINALFSDYIGREYYINPTDITHGEEVISYPNWIITDLRFPNELEAIKKRDGITIRVNRKKSNLQLKERQKVCSESVAIEVFKDTIEYPSETSLDNSTFDYTIENNGTIEELVEKIREILIKEKIL